MNPSMRLSRTSPGQFEIEMADLLEISKALAIDLPQRTNMYAHLVCNLRMSFFHHVSGGKHRIHHLTG